MSFLTLSLLPALIGLCACGGSVIQATSQTGDALSKNKKDKQIMCMWNAFGKREYMCSTDSMAKAQKDCDEKATKVRGERSTCSCTDDPNYIKDMCDSGTEPPVTSGWRRR